MTLRPMQIRINHARLRSKRLDRGWSQDQLADISGLSVRTIQRLENGRAATPASLSALAIALAAPESELLASDGPIRRITPLTILNDIGAVQRLYETLGLELVTTDSPDCVGLRAENTRLILCSTGLMQSGYGDAAGDLAGKTIPYIWVRSLDREKRAYSVAIDKVDAGDGVREALVEAHGQWAILAETVSR